MYQRSHCLQITYNHNIHLTDMYNISLMHSQTNPVVFSVKALPDTSVQVYFLLNTDTQIMAFGFSQTFELLKVTRTTIPLRHAPPRVSAQFRAVRQLAIMAGSQLVLSAAMASSTGTDRVWSGHVETETRSLEGRKRTMRGDHPQSPQANGPRGHLRYTSAGLHLKLPTRVEETMFVQCPNFKKGFSYL